LAAREQTTQEIITQAWQTRGALAFCLLPLAIMFALLSWLRRMGYRLGFLEIVKLPVPLIVVGNITAGGSGKTPLVLFLAQELARNGRKPGIISRGYGGASAQNDQVLEVRSTSQPSEVGDEPLLLSRRAGCPVFVGRDRVAAARALIAAYPTCDVIISDDGLQHYRLARDVEIAVVDERGLGNGWLLPAGPLREAPRRLRQVDAVVLNGSASLPRHLLASATNSHPRVFHMRLQAERFIHLRDSQRSCTADDLLSLAAQKTHTRIHAIAGIGHPERFFRQLEQLGLQCEAHRFPDHHRYIPADLQFNDADVLLMTEKDAVKCQTFASDALPEETWVLPVAAKLEAKLEAGLEASLQADLNLPPLTSLTNWTLERLDGCQTARNSRMPRL